MAERPADALVRERELGRPDPVLVGAGGQHHVVGGLVHHPQAEPDPDVGADPAGQGFLVVYAIPILWPHAKADLLLLICELVADGIWLVFLADLVTRVYLADHRWAYLGRHPLDLLVVALPALRPLRILRVFTAGQVILTRGKDFAIGRTLAAAAGAAALITLIAALAELDAERGHPGANIETFREALWWAGVTITTVGYGDRYPVTPAGQAVAFALMIVGISLLSLITATVAAWFLAKVRAPAARDQQSVMAELRELRNQIAAVAAADAPTPRQGDGDNGYARSVPQGEHETTMGLLRAPSVYRTIIQPMTAPVLSHALGSLHGRGTASLRVARAGLLAAGGRGKPWKARQDLHDSERAIWSAHSSDVGHLRCRCPRNTWATARYPRRPSLQCRAVSDDPAIVVLLRLVPWAVPGRSAPVSEAANADVAEPAIVPPGSGTVARIGDRAGCPGVPVAGRDVSCRVIKR